MKTVSAVVLPEEEGRQIKGIVRGRMGVPAHQLARAKVAGLLCLNGESVHADHRVAAGQTVSVTLFDDEPEFTVKPESEPVSVLYEDEDLIVIDKPAPLATQSSPKQPDNTLENRLMFRYGEGFVFRPVNRLDKGTSGLMLAAKHAHAQLKLSADLHTDAFVREYLAITEGMPGEKRGVINLPIGKADGATVRREIRHDGKPSVTHYEVLEEKNGLALVHLRLETGRTHQIRVHLSAIGCPVYGDFLYGTERPDTLPGRFALHSHFVRFTHPMTGEVLEFTSELPPELLRLMSVQEEGGGT